MGAGQLEPAAAERRLCWYRPYSGSPSVGSPRAPATSTPPRSISVQPSRIASWIARQRSRWSAPGWSSRAPAWSPEWTVDRRPPWRYRIRPASGAPPVAPGLEVDEVAGRERRAPPGDERRARAEREVPPLAGLEQQVVEPVEGGRRRGSLGVANPSPGPAGRDARVVADDAIDRLLGLPDPLAGRLGDRRRRPSSSRPAGERQRDPVARRLDLLDRLEPGGLDRRAEAGVRGRHLGVGGDDVDPVVRPARRRSRPGARRGPPARRRAGPGPRGR